MNQHGHKLMSEVLEAPITHIPAERVRKAGLTVVERGSFQDGPWSVEDVKDVLSMLGVNARTLREGMFHAAEERAS